jgi:hypothetical protein
MNMRHDPVITAKLRERLKQLSEHYHVVALKTGTEVEDMDRDEIAFMREISREGTQNILPLVVKIGGPEARRDIRECLEIGVGVILAPMVETAYALANFVETAKGLMRDSATHAALAINLETGTAVRNLDAMIATRAFSELSQVTIGRGDLSKSMHLSVDDEEVLTATRNVLTKLARQKKLTSVGGGLTVNNIITMSEVLPSHRFNTRHTVFANGEAFANDASRNLSEGLYFEQELYESLAILNPRRAAFYTERNRQLEERLPNLRISRNAAM